MIGDTPMFTEAQWRTIYNELISSAIENDSGAEASQITFEDFIKDASEEITSHRIADMLNSIIAKLKRGELKTINEEEQEETICPVQ